MISDPSYSLFAGWGNVAFTGGKDISYFLVPIFGPLVGACLGAFGYRVLIGYHLPGAVMASSKTEKTVARAEQRKA